MRGNDFLDKMELVDPAYVEAADAKPQKRRNIWIPAGAVACCLCLLIAGVLAVGRFHAPQQSGPANLEPVTVPEVSIGGMGFEGYMCHDVSELDNGNPWSAEKKITSLPVYKNGAYDPSGAGIPVGLGEEEMVKQLNFAADALHLEIRSTDIAAGDFAEESGEAAAGTNPPEICAETDNGTVTVQADGEIVYSLPGEGLALPAEYHFTQNDTTEDEAKDVLSYLISAYGDFLDFKKPEAISSEDCDIYGEFNCTYQVYDASGDDLEDLLNFNFRCVNFYPNDSGKLSIIRRNNGLLSAEKLGDYPVITAAEAEERLSAGNYQTSVPAAFSGEESIGRVELVYRTGRSEEILMPYYRFYVLLPESVYGADDEEGLKTYGAYYVPAVAEEYIADMPIYDGDFN